MNADVQKELKRRVDKIRALPSSPTILQPLLQLLRQPAEEVDMRKVVELVSYEKSIASQCLRIVNSPLYGKAAATESIQQAVMSLGIQKVEEILLSCCLNQLVPASKWSTHPAVFWRHSLGCAMVAREFAERIEFKDTEKAYLAGLLHDLGILVNSFAYAQEYGGVLTAATKNGRPLGEEEMEMLGFAHTDSGGILAHAWRLPPDVIEVIQWHHDLEHAPQENALVALVHLSDLLCRSCGLGYGYEEWRGVDLAADSAWAVLAKRCPKMENMDMFRFTLDMESSVGRINEVVDEIFAPH